MSAPEQQPIQVEQPTQPSQKKTKKGKKEKKEKIIMGATDYKSEQYEHKESEPKPKQTQPRPKQQHKKGSNPHHQHQYHQQPQFSQQRFLEATYSYNIVCLFEENCLSLGSFMRKFMDDDGFIKCEIFATIFQFVFFLFY